MDNAWIKGFPGAITVCDPEGIILEMNDRAGKMFLEQGGKGLIGSNLLECHPAQAREKLEKIMEQRQANAYTIEKNGRKKMIYQSPWFVDGEFRGLVEIVLDLPEALPHYIRK